MIQGLIVLVVLIMMIGIGIRLSAHEGDPAEDSDYVELQKIGSGMSRRAFHRIREQNRQEQKQFGKGDHAPHYPRQRYNGQATLHRGVWVYDDAPRPSNRVLDEFRKKHTASHRVIRFTLIEGEQDAPYGKDGAMIRVRATTGTPGTISGPDGVVRRYMPTVNISPVNQSDGWWGSTFMGALPVEMSISVKESD